MLFRSAVQLRIVDLVLMGQSSLAGGEISDTQSRVRTNRHKKHAKRASPVTTGSNAKLKKTSKGGKGAVATLIKVHQEGFFKSPRTIKDILAHCETNLARRIKANEISGKLARMVRSGDLKRVKNADSQYEYTNP